MDKITAVIRYKDSARTLPEVLESIQKQTHPVDQIVAVDTGSRDDSTRLLLEAGAKIVKWSQPYHHSKVTNFGFSHCETPFVLCLSSHTAMSDATIVAKLLHSMEDTQVAASSICWDDDDYYSDRITQAEIVDKGLKLGSIYTNSLGLVRKSCWDAYHFDESINGVEDYEWAIHQLQAGYSIARIQAEISYQRKGHNRILRGTARVFYIANRYRLPVTWLGIKESSVALARNLPGKIMRKPSAVETFDYHARRLMGALFWRFIDLNIN
ncbi:glycosyltransferase [Coraliomargarita algicola]|uniref:Glycosyltransferase n=1 Tax=Coraliomargarita algicola TaxID=3092156 RepID=A0ABZ0RN28_9BACT|nr:glycosyltransferase [Coraliomargarita sp. J2-16]WPJ96811.1 glycosyltransferase [Coraliomargarita sp. J2-16]